MNASIESPSPTGSQPGTALVTGASSGIGAVYARRLAARGHRLILVARRVDRLSKLAEALHAEFGVPVAALPLDLGREADLARAVQCIENDADITLVVNNAGVAAFGPAADVESTAQRGMVDVNVTAFTQVARAAVGAFKRRGRGTLVNIGSVLSYHALPFSATYAGSKAYVLNFTRGLQAEVAGTKVVVQFVGPSATATDIWDNASVPLASLDKDRVMSVDDLVDAALAGLDQGEAITLPSVEDPQLLADYEQARLKLFAASQTGRPASRYGVGR